MGGTIDADRIFQRHTVSDIRQVGCLMEYNYSSLVFVLREEDETHLIRSVCLYEFT